MIRFEDASTGGAGAITSRCFCFSETTVLHICDRTFSYGLLIEISRCLPTRYVLLGRHHANPYTHTRTSCANQFSSRRLSILFHASFIIRRTIVSQNALLYPFSFSLDNTVSRIFAKFVRFPDTESRCQRNVEEFKRLEFDERENERRKPRNDRISTRGAIA